MKNLFYFFLGVVFLMTSCSQNYKTRLTMKKMVSAPFVIPTDDMLAWRSGSANTCDLSNAKTKVIIFADSADCSTCHINGLKLWKDFLWMEEKTEGQIAFYFIMESPKGEERSLYSTLFKSELKHPIYVDTSHIFRTNNPHLPDSRLFHTFVLDSANHVILVGNPLKNENVEKLFLKIASQYLPEDAVLDSLGHVVFVPKEKDANHVE